uniref:Pectinesterase inhibitor domain-containing protein n=1 Tax=Salix viminalis TaxID=40686 RepID=A0A6N2MFI2_SALVM
MDSCRLLALTLFLFTLSYQFLVIKSDEALIQNLCHKTPEPVLCADCLHLDPGSKDADGRGVALITVRCAESDAEQVYNFTFNLWQKTPKSDVALYNTLDTCSIQFLVAHDSFRGATLTSQVSPYLNRCLELFKKQPQLPLPNTILIGTEAVNQGIAVSLGILKNIPDKLTLS